MRLAQGKLMEAPERTHLNTLADARCLVGKYYPEKVRFEERLYLVKMILDIKSKEIKMHLGHLLIIQVTKMVNKVF